MRLDYCVDLSCSEVGPKRGGRISTFTVLNQTFGMVHDCSGTQFVSQLSLVCYSTACKIVVILPHIMNFSGTCASFLLKCKKNELPRNHTSLAFSLVFAIRQLLEWLWRHGPFHYDFIFSVRTYADHEHFKYSMME